MHVGDIPGSSGSGTAATIDAGGATAVSNGTANSWLVEDASAKVAVVAGGANRIPYQNTTGVPTTSAGLTYNDSTTVFSAAIMQVGSHSYFTDGVTRVTMGPFNGDVTMGSTTSKEFYFQSAGLTWVRSTSGYSWTTSATDASTQVQQAGMKSSGVNSVTFGGASSDAGGATTRTEINKSTTAIADNVATATLTVTVPNAAHSASIKVTFSGSAGAGGAVGANEATATASYDIAVTRTAGANAAAVISTVYGSATASVAGGTVLAVTGTLSAISGAVGATNTFTINVTIAHTLGSSTNHTCFTRASLMNANASGVTVA
jgi:hypothetical protein